MELGTVTRMEAASTLLHPLRLEILERAKEPVSASQVAQELDLPRQKVNYHLKELVNAGFLEPAGERRKRNMIEKRYVVSARGWVLSPELLGRVAADPARVRDRLSAEYLQALANRMQSDLARIQLDASAQGKRLATMSIDTDIRFESAKQRKEFAAALQQAVAQVVAEHSSPYRNPQGKAGKGRPYRLVLGCHPIPADPGGKKNKGRNAS